MSRKRVASQIANLLISEQIEEENSPEVVSPPPRRRRIRPILPKDLRPEEVPDQEPAEEPEQEPEYNYTRLLDIRIVDGVTQYLVLWEDGSSNWEPDEHINHEPAKIKLRIVMGVLTVIMYMVFTRGGRYGWGRRHA